MHVNGGTINVPPMRALVAAQPSQPRLRGARPRTTAALARNADAAGPDVPICWRREEAEARSLTSPCLPSYSRPQHIRLLQFRSNLPVPASPAIGPDPLGGSPGGRCRQARTSRPSALFCTGRERRYWLVAHRCNGGFGRVRLYHVIRNLSSAPFRNSKCADCLSFLS